MALNFSVDEAAMQIKDDGFCLIRDPTIVSALDEMIQTHSPFRFSDEKGFNFWRDNIHTDPRIRGIMNVFESDRGVKYILGDRGSLFQDPTHIKTLRRGGQHPDILTIQVWPKGSDAIYYQRSHTATLPRGRVLTGEWEFIPKDLENSGYHGERLDLEQGGIVFFDTRIAIDLVKGRSQYYSYFTEAQLERDRPQPLIPPPTQDVNEVAKLGVHVRPVGSRIDVATGGA